MIYMIYLYNMNNETKTNETMKNLIRVRIYPLDYNGNKSNLDYVTYVNTIEEAEKLGWKYERAW